jgi:hypothetical protein
MIPGLLQAQQSSSSGAAASVPAVPPQIQGLTGSNTSSYAAPASSTTPSFLLEDGSFLLEENGDFLLLG